MSIPCIVLVEDGPLDIRIVRRVLARSQVKALLRVLSDGLEAIRYLNGLEPFGDRRHFPLPCLILLDLDLPIFDGHEVLAWLRRTVGHAAHGVPVVILTTSDAEADRVQAARFGAVHYLIKPLSVEALVATLRDLGLTALLEGGTGEVPGETTLTGRAVECPGGGRPSAK